MSGLQSLSTTDGVGATAQAAGQVGAPRRAGKDNDSKGITPGAARISPALLRIPTGPRQLRSLLQAGCRCLPLSPSSFSISRSTSAACPRRRKRCVHRPDRACCADRRGIAAARRGRYERLVAPRIPVLPVASARGRQLDLNLLVALDALLAEGNVTRAAERLGLSQPAMIWLRGLIVEICRTL